jgi:glutathione S-transferase
MPLILFWHPFSSYCQKVLIALYENETPFTPRMLDNADPSVFSEFVAYWPLKRFPLLLDDGKPIAESSIIIEHLGLKYPGPVRLIPADQERALEVRFMDRFFDNYVQTPMQAIVSNALRAEAARDKKWIADSQAMLEKSYGWLENRMAKRKWAAGNEFSLADCADWTYPISTDFPNLRAYRSHLNARPSFARAIDEARPYRSYFPLGAPDRD